MMKPTDARPFTDSLREYRNGALVRHLTDAQAEVLAAVAKHRKKGSLTLSMTFTPEEGSERGIQVDASVSIKVPKPSLPKALFYVADGGLFRNDPGQTEMFEEVVDPVTGEVTDRPKLRGVDGGRSDVRPAASRDDNAANG